MTSVSVWDLNTIPTLELYQLSAVHDDAVVHDADALLRVEVGVGVLVGLAAVRRPARVGDADVQQPACLSAWARTNAMESACTAFARVLRDCQRGEFVPLLNVAMPALS